VTDVVRAADPDTSDDGALPAGYSSQLWNGDLAPTTKRDWGAHSLFCM
jgi:hypothetical protein